MDKMAEDANVQYLPHPIPAGMVVKYLSGLSNEAFQYNYSPGLSLLGILISVGGSQMTVASSLFRFYSYYSII